MSTHVTIAGTVRLRNSLQAKTAARGRRLDEGAGMRIFSGLIAVLALLVGLAATASPAKAQSGMTITGTTRVSVTQTPLKDVCVTLGPPIRCWFVAGQPNGLHTDAAGNFTVELPEGTAPGGTWDLYFVC